MTRRQAISVLSSVVLDRFLDPKTGCALLMDAHTGRILAANSSRLSETFLAPPGSALKPFTLFALLQSRKLRPDFTFTCPEKLTLEGRRFDCSHPRLGLPLDVAAALAYSCNCFVAHVAERFAPGELASALHGWGFGVSEARNQPLQAIGETNVTATPQAMANAYRRLASQLSAAPEILQGLEGAVEYGTGQLARVSWAKVAGKTGSTRSGGGFISWFGGFAPSRAPEVAVAVMTSGKHGGSDAAPVARQILEAWHAGRL